jgi:anaerobic selenocysteine-containing dehydrogenase
LNNVNPVYTNPTTGDIERILQNEALFVVSFSNFMDETTAMADLVLPVSLPLEAWDEYGGKLGIVSTLQPAMGKFRNRVLIGDVFLKPHSTKTVPKTVTKPT